MSSSHALVLLPGLDGTDVFLRPLVNTLPSRIRSRIVCFPDRGASDYPRLLDVVRTAVQSLSRYYVLGLSFSGPLAPMLAAAHPNRVQGVILASTFVRPPRPHYRRLRFAAVTPIVWAMRASRRLPIWFASGSKSPLWRDKCETWSRVNSRMVAARMRAVLAVDARDDLRACAHPVLCLTGRDDRIVPYRNVEEILHVRPSTRVQVIDGDHFALYTNPRSAAQVIGAFMDDHSRFTSSASEGDTTSCASNLSVDCSASRWA